MMKINQFLNKKQLLTFYLRRNKKKFHQRYNHLGFGDQGGQIRLKLIRLIILIHVQGKLQV